MVGDMVYAVCTRENMKVLREHTGKQKREIKNIIVYGASRIAQKAVQELPEGMSIKILEANRDLCYHISDKVNNALIINADGSDMNSLQEEGIQDADAFIAVTDRSEANIFACLAAKRFGVKKTIAEVENILAHAVIIDETEQSSGRISLGCTIKVEDMETGDEELYAIVGSQEANPMECRISDDSPFGKALLGHKVGDIVDVEAPIGVLKYKILTVEK